MQEKICCFTGHRPNAFPWKEDETDPRRRQLQGRLEEAIDGALRSGVKYFICGNALGVDTWAAQIVLKKKETDPSIRLEIALPFPGHNKASAVCAAVQRGADLVHVVSAQKSWRLAALERDRYMVDRSDMLIAVYDDPEPRRSGTQYTYQLARNKGIDIILVPWGDL